MLLPHLVHNTLLHPSIFTTAIPQLAFGDEEGDQRALRHESFVAEGKHSPFVNDITNLLTVRQQTRKVFSVICDYIVEKFAV
jgi:hypothetical protein